jgi:hypothetical protein
MKKPWRGRSRWFFATWNGSVRRAHKRLRAARISRPQPLINTKKYCLNASTIDALDENPPLT